MLLNKHDKNSNFFEDYIFYFRFILITYWSYDIKRPMQFDKEQQSIQYIDLPTVIGYQYVKLMVGGATLT